MYEACLLFCNTVLYRYIVYYMKVNFLCLIIDALFIILKPITKCQRMPLRLFIASERCFASVAIVECELYLSSSPFRQPLHLHILSCTLIDFDASTLLLFSISMVVYFITVLPSQITTFVYYIA